MADNEKGLKMMFELCGKLENNEINFIEFLKEMDDVAFDELSSNGVRHFSDGWREGSASNLYRYVLKAYGGDSKALERLLVDLGIEECNLTVVRKEM